jgi:hypothetical protein
MSTTLGFRMIVFYQSGAVFATILYLLRSWYETNFVIILLLLDHFSALSKVLSSSSRILGPISHTTMAVPEQADGPQVVTLTNEERDSGIMGDKKLYDAIEAFFTDGLVVIENAVDVEIIDKLNVRMLKDTEKLLAGQGQVHFK